ncbi:MAG TPA: UDP-N-acetylmuramate dehydrogenase [Acidimicrobiales bacterium]|nr:UDP-N-acetylmuramate dehydrogenase [Acidimicrobiales bacterium]
MSEEADRLLSDGLGSALRREVSLAPFTTYRVGGPARWAVDVDDEATLSKLASVVGTVGVPVLVIGLGSNLLVSDAGFDGLVVRLAGTFAAISIERTQVTAGGAAKLPVVARASVSAGLTGFEWAVGVPGSVGGAVRMNAGGHGADMSDSLHSIRVLDLTSGEDARMAASALHLGYRTSAIRPEHLVLDARLDLEPDSDARGPETISEIVRWRRAHQPGGPNAGSVFTNPPGDSAGRLIEAAGLKGHRFGTAEVSAKHANFIQVDPGGRAADVLALMGHVRRVVADTHGIELEVETRIVGFGAEVDQR